MITVYVPIDSSALALGADSIAEHITDFAAQHNIEIQLIRNGSRGMLWLEPLVEVQTDAARIG